MKTRILNLQQAYELYKLIAPVYPEGEEELLPFLKVMFENIQETDPSITVKMLELILGEDTSRIETLGKEDVFVAFLDGFEKNRIVDLREFFGGLENAQSI